MKYSNALRVCRQTRCARASGQSNIEFRFRKIQNARVPPKIRPAYMRDLLSPMCMYAGRAQYEKGRFATQSLDFHGTASPQKRRTKSNTRPKIKRTKKIKHCLLFDFFQTTQKNQTTCCRPDFFKHFTLWEPEPEP